MYIFMYEFTYVCNFVYLCACMCTKSPLPCHCTHNSYVTERKEYGYHIVNINHTAIMLYGPMGLTFLHVCFKTQPTAISTSHVIAMYVPATNIPLKCQICKLGHVHIWHNYVSINASYELNVRNNATRYTGIHFTLLAYAPEKICLPHCTYMSHCTTIIIYI